MSLATQAQRGETYVARGPCTAPPGPRARPTPSSLYQGALPPKFSNLSFFSTSFNHHIVKEPHSEESFSATGFPFSPL